MHFILWLLPVSELTEFPWKMDVAKWPTIVISAFHSPSLHSSPLLPLPSLPFHTFQVVLIVLLSQLFTLFFSSRLSPSARPCNSIRVSLDEMVNQLTEPLLGCSITWKLKGNILSISLQIAKRWLEGAKSWTQYRAPLKGSGQVWWIIGGKIAFAACCRQENAIFFTSYSPNLAGAF